MSLYRTRDQRIADEVSTQHMACLRCRKLTLTETLSQYGARCFECHEAYCRFGQPEGRPLAREEKVAILDKLRSVTTAQQSGREWAHRLRDRHLAGGSLSRTQRDAINGLFGEAA